MADEDNEQLDAEIEQLRQQVRGNEARAITRLLRTTLARSRLASQLRVDPYAYAAHVSYVGKLQQAGRADELAHARHKFAEAFPLTERAFRAGNRIKCSATQSCGWSTLWTRRPRYRRSTTTSGCWSCLSALCRTIWVPALKSRIWPDAWQRRKCGSRTLTLCWACPLLVGIAASCERQIELVVMPIDCDMRADGDFAPALNESTLARVRDVCERAVASCGQHPVQARRVDACPSIDACAGQQRLGQVPRRRGDVLAPARRGTTSCITSTLN